MTTEEVALLWEQYVSQHDIDIRNELLLHHVNMVKSIVYRMLPSYRNHVEAEDLISYGVLGLIDAIEKFDTTMGIKFEAYAYTRVKGAIIDHLRKLDWAPASLRRRIKKISQTLEILESELGRVPKDSEIAERLQIREEAVKDALENSYTFNLMSLDELFTETLSNNEQTPEEVLNESELVGLVSKAVDRLPERERMVMTLYYYENMNLKEIGAVMGVGESRVSQIHSKAVLLMKSYLKAQGVG